MKDELFNQHRSLGVERADLHEDTIHIVTAGCGVPVNKPQTLLLVEDDRHIALAFKIRLTAAGYTVYMCTSVTEARAIAGVCTLDAAVFDINLPDGNGLDLMVELQARQQAKPIVCIVMSASKTVGLREKAMKMGAYEFLEKPFHSAELLDAIQSHFAIAHAS